MFRQSEPNPHDLTPDPANATVRLGPLRKLRLALPLPFIRRGPPLIIPEAHKPLWTEKGWRPAANAKEYTGRFSAGGHSLARPDSDPLPGRLHGLYLGSAAG